MGWMAFDRDSMMANVSRQLKPPYGIGALAWIPKVADLRRRVWADARPSADRLRG